MDPPRRGARQSSAKHRFTDLGSLESHSKLFFGKGSLALETDARKAISLLRHVLFKIADMLEPQVSRLRWVTGMTSWHLRDLSDSADPMCLPARITAS